MLAQLPRAPRLLSFLAGLACCWAAAGAAPSAESVPAAEDRLLTVPLARGTELSAVVTKLPGTQPDTAVLIFPGHPGILRIRQTDGRLEWDLRGNFLVRSRARLVSDRLFTVMVDCPRDQWASCNDTYRSSSAHADDVAALIARLRDTEGARHVYLIGTSYGTVSSALLARKLAGKIDGAIHTATFTDPKSRRDNDGGMPLWHFDFSAAQVDQLFVHHRADPCPLTRYSRIVELKGALPLITVVGTQGERGDACQAFSAHGFVGRERAVMRAIGDWIESRRVAQTVGG